MSGSGERVVPLLVGVIAFIIVLAFVVSNLGIIGGSGSVPGGGLALTGTYDYWDPGNITIDSSRVSDFYPDYPAHANNFTKDDMNDVVFYVVRDNTDLVGPDGEQLYEDCLVFDQRGGLFDWYVDRFAVSYPALIQLSENTGSTLVEVQCNLWEGNYSIFIQTAGADQTDFTTNLWFNDFNVSFATYSPPAGPTTSTNVLEMIWWVMTLNTAWLPTYPVVVYITGVFVDTVIILCIIRLLWGG